MTADERTRARRSITQLKAHLAKYKGLEKNFGEQYERAVQYYEDAKHYFDKGDYFTSFGCSDYAYGLLDAVVMVKENQYFPEPTVGAVILNSRGQVFLMKSHKFGDRYVIPGGHVELGESMEEALAREIKEETNLDVYGLRHVILQELIYDPIFWKRRHFIFVDYVCRARDPHIVKLNGEGQSFVWMDVDKALKSRDIEPYTLKTIKRTRELGLC